ncbi:hypothetical protein K8T06_00265, partial [bacterium]|nr:hypothetical protein [bacterium]
DPGRGIDVLDVSDPLNPILTAEISFNGLTVIDFVLQGTLLYLAGGEDGVFVWDIKDPEIPVLFAWANTPGDALGIAFDEHNLYVADEFDFSVFARQEFRIDLTLPVVNLQFPQPLARIQDKVLLIHGKAEDQGSGIQKVEISVDEGVSWKQAYGQENWSLFVSGEKTGPVPIRVRATDWSGNISEKISDIWVYYDPSVPQIFIAGYGDSHVVAGMESTIILSALVKDPWDEIYLKEAILYLNGQPTSQIFDSSVSGDGYVFYRTEYVDTFTGTGWPDFSIVIRDIYNNESNHWPGIPSKW